MPNWCHNTVSIHAPLAMREEIGNFLSAQIIHPDGIEYSKFSLNKIVPEPKYEGRDEWYEWRCNNWGVKWEIDPMNITKIMYPRSLFYAFETPWCPPMPAYGQLSKRFPQAKFYVGWNEPGMRLRGRVLILDGFAYPKGLPRIEAAAY